MNRDHISRRECPSSIVKQKTYSKYSTITPVSRNLHLDKKASLSLILKSKNETFSESNDSFNFTKINFCDDENNEENLFSKNLNDKISYLPFLSNIQQNETLENNSKNDEIFPKIDSALQESNLKVAIRLRPFLSKEQRPIIDNEAKIRIKNNKVLVKTERSSVMNDPRSKFQMFEFDHAFDSSNNEKIDFASQEKVFRIIGEPILDYSLEGYNTCLFAYGQSGSGKTFTMMGTESNPGIIPRLLRLLFRRAYDKKQVKMTITISFLEIYQEKLYDLLGDDFDHFGILRVRENPELGVHIPNLATFQVESSNDALELLKKGNDKRSKSETALNIESSRSHAVFSVSIVQKSLVENINESSKETEKTLVSKINFVDLAGSERPVDHGEGQRFREGTFINKSLFTLGKVIDSLTRDDKLQVIPYRESQLTFLLKDSLGGNSRTFMIATVSPSKDHLEETLSTLRYASTASKIVNTVKVNQDPTFGYIKSLLRQISFLKKQLSPENSLVLTSTQKSELKTESFQSSPEKLSSFLISHSSKTIEETTAEEKLKKTIKLFKNSIDAFGDKAKQLKNYQEEFSKNLDYFKNFEGKFRQENSNEELRDLLKEMKEFQVKDHSPDYESYLKQIE